MSQQSTTGRSGRLPLNNTRYNSYNSSSGGCDDGVTVKTLPSSSSSYPHSSRKLYSSKDEQGKYKRESNTKWSGGRNGEIVSKSKVIQGNSSGSGSNAAASSNTSSATTPTTTDSSVYISSSSGASGTTTSMTAISNSNNNVCVSTSSSFSKNGGNSSHSGSTKDSSITAGTGNKKDTANSYSNSKTIAVPHSSTYGHGEGRKKSYYGSSPNHDVEVRTRPSNNGGRRIAADKFSGAPSKSERSSASSAGGSSAHHGSRISGRLYTSEKYRNNDTRDFFRRNVPDPTLGKLLNNAIHDDGNQTHSSKLQEFITDRSNYRTIVKCSQILWDALLQLLTAEGKLAPRAPTRRIFIDCLARAGTCSIDAQSRYPDSEGSYRFYQWVFERCNEAGCEGRISLLAVISEVIMNKSVHITPSMAQFLVGKLHTILDNTGDIEELFAVLKIVMYFAHHHREAFAPVFADVVDILAGWSVDPEQTDDTISRIAEILISLQPYWVEDMPMCVVMTNNFQDDLQTMTRHILDKDREPLDAAKIALLIRLLQTSVRAVGDQFNHERNTDIHPGFVCECLSRMITSIDNLTAAGVEGLMPARVALVDCIGTLADCGEDVSTVASLTPFIIGQSNCLVKNTIQSVVVWLVTLNQLYKTCRAENLLPLTNHFFTLDLTSLKLSSNGEVQCAALDLHRSLFASKHPDTVQVAFKKTKEQIDVCLSYLTGESRPDWSASRADVIRSKQRSQELILFHLSSLTHVATDTNNLIFMYMLEPTIFNFLLKDILLVYGSNLKDYSSINYHLIALLHIHCNSHKNFIAKSNLCAADTTRRGRHHIALNKNNGDNFSMILESMAEMFSLMRDSSRGLKLLTKWVCEITEQVATLNPPLLNNIQLVTMVTNVLSLDDEILAEADLLNIADALAVWIEHSKLTPNLLSTILDYTMYQLSSQLPAVRRKYLFIITRLPVDSLQRAQSHELMRRHNQALALRRSIMSGSCGSLNVEQFRAVASMLFKQYTNHDDLDQQWLQRLLISAEKPSTSDLDKSSLLERVLKHSGLLEHWLLWQTADFCVAHRLRTPIGKPLDTFMCIEAAIKQIAADNRIEVSPKCEADTKRVWLLLQFMENLEKALYNAYEGTAGHLTTHGKVVRSFFRTNKGTCIEWLTRIRLHILSIACTYGHPATVIRHGYELITDMLRSQSTQTPEFELVLVYMTEAWCQLNCSEAIQGLYEWCKAACNRKLAWLKPFFLKAMNRYEDSATELKVSLSNMLSPPALGDSIKLQTRPNPYVSAVTQLTAQQITDCYTSLQSWDEAADWLNEFDGMKSTNNALAGVSALGHCDKVMMADEEAGAELISWSKQQHLAQLWRDSVNADTKPGSLINEGHSLLRIELSSDWPAAIQPGTLLTLLSQRLEESTPRIGNLTNMTSQPYSLPWLLKLSKLSDTQLVSADMHTDVLINCCREARHSGNLKLAHKLMSQLPKSTQDAEVDGVAMRIAREAAKQVYFNNNCTAALQKMSTIALHPLDDASGDNLPELVARSTLTVVKWLQSEPQLLHALSEGTGVESAPSLYRFSSECSGYAVDTPTIPQADKILGAMLQKSTEQCSSLAKTWYCFGNWAYKWGRKCLDNAEQSLSAEEIQQVEGFLPNDVTPQEKEEILSVMSMVQGTFTSPDEDLTEDSPDYGDDDLQEIRRRLISCCPSLSNTIVEELVQLWTTTARRAYTLYEESAKAYFSYLNMCSTSQGVGHHNVTITLRLLRLLVKHAWELRGVLEADLKSTPTAPWRNIIPQLFSRLNHPELYVRQSVSELLARLADDYPHLIVYPAIVGCNQSSGQLDNAVPYMDNSQDSTSAESAPGLTDCFQQLVETLSSANPNLIKQVRTLVNELCRITVLWDELWLGSLNQLSATASERIKALASEVERVKNNSSLTDAERSLLIREKRETIAKPLIHTIERLSDITGKQAETKHEQWFQETYNHLIEKGLEKLTNPAKDEDLTSDWQPFKQLHVSLQQRSQKRSSHMLKMKDLSNVLASLDDTYVPLPGAVAKGDKQPITLQSVYPTLQILPTKTKPKKLAFLGSDGQKYYYLFKGLEDLHLDERIMQLLNIVNDMLVPKGTSDSDCALYRARNYSVTPLGLRSGLIAWVDGCLPLFSLYKRWQLREAAAQAKPNGNNSTASRPSEMLYSKLLPLLKPLLEDRGLNPKEVKLSEVEKIRKDWPLAALVTATKQLIAETPSHLVAKEMWCQSTSANEWWSMTKTYCRSVAVMSAIGYILGLGDRHLDNLLLDPNNGEMVHIDYNVCFDKGKSLRVPERVPFRLTNNIVAAMGATGVEGIFRSACEHTIKSMRLGKETLLTLLEAFVYDPLVDWTVGGETGLAGAFYGGNYAFGDAAKDYRRRKKQMERDITRSMFSIRVTEMKSAWLLNKEEMASELTEVVDQLNTFITETMRVSSLTEQTAQCKDILKYIEELKKEGGQAINRLVQRFAAQQKLVAAKDECVREVRAMSDELTKYTNLHQTAVNTVTSPALQALEDEIKRVPALGPSPGALARPFMQTVGQLPQLDQLEQYQEQLVHLVEKRTDQMFHCKQSLAHYGSIINVFPADQYASNHLMGDCLRFISLLEQEMDTTTCEEVARLYQSATCISPSKAQISKVLSIERALQRDLSADIEKLDRMVERSEADEYDINVLIGQYKSKQQDVNNYRSLHGELGHRSLMFIVLPKLAEITKRCLALESTANKSGDRLHYLTSRDGDWFLDELSWVTDNMAQYVALMQVQPNESSAATCSPIPHHVISGIHKVYAASQDMLLNFQQVILPDTLMSLVKGEQSVNDVISLLTSHVIRSHDLEKICSKLDSTLRNMVFGATEVDGAVASAVGELRNCYKQVFLREQDSEEMSKGSMLCKVLNGLFEHVYKEYTSAMQGLASLVIPKSWRKVDVIRDAGTLQLSQYNENTLAILGDLFFVKQLIAMKEFYSSATQYVNIFKVGEQTSIDSYDMLSRPLKTFIADFVRKQLLGVASQSAGFLICEHLSDIGLDVEKEIALKDFGASSTVYIDDLCKKGLDRRTQTGTQLSQANALISNFEAAWKKQDLAKRLLRNRLLLKALVDQQKRCMLCYQWLHEDVLSVSQTPHFQLTRKEVLTELHRSLSALMSTNSSYSDVLDKLTNSENAISQRLKWAAGANPKLTPVLAEFEKAQNNRTAVFQKQSAIVKELSTYCHSVLHLETMRTKSQEAANLDLKFKQLVSRCLEVCKTLEEDDQLSELPHKMISLMSKADRQKTGNAFLGRAHDATQSHLSSIGSKIKSLNKLLAQVIEKYKASVTNLQQGTLNSHHKLISEVRAVLKTLAKEELEDPVHLGTRVQDYLADYKVFSEKIANVVKMLSLESMSEQLRDNVSALVSDLQGDIEGIFTRLIDLAKPLTLADGEQSGDGLREEGAESGPNTTSPMSTSGSKNVAGAIHGPAERIQRDPKTGKAVQERNSYAVSVWRRVKMKLDGRELDPNKKMSVTDQVSYVISEATDVRNLAQMYEGWTSWV